LTTALDGNEWIALCPGCFTPGTHRTGGWMGPTVSLDAVAKRENYIIAPAGKLTPVIQPVA